MGSKPDGKKLLNGVYLGDHITSLSWDEYERARGKPGRVWSYSPIVNRFAELVTGGGTLMGDVPHVDGFADADYFLPGLREDLIDARGLTWWRHVTHFWHAVGAKERLWLDRKGGEVMKKSAGFGLAAGVADGVRSAIFCDLLDACKDTPDRDEEALMWCAVASGFRTGMARFPCGTGYDYNYLAVWECGLLTQRASSNRPDRFRDAGSAVPSPYGSLWERVVAKRQESDRKIAEEARVLAAKVQAIEDESEDDDEDEEFGDWGKWYDFRYRTGDCCDEIDCPYCFSCPNPVCDRCY